LTASKKFFFFLDSKRSGKINIKDLLNSKILAELISSRNNKTDEKNWFTAVSFMKIYNLYIRLDVDKDSMISKQELLAYKWGFTKIFIDRVFEES